MHDLFEISAGKRRSITAGLTFARSERIAAMIFLFVVPRMTESAARHGIPSPFRICRQKSLHSQKRDTASYILPGHELAPRIRMPYTRALCKPRDSA